MTSATDKQTTTDTAEPATSPGLDEASIGAYLSEHPDFLLRNPEVLAQLQIPHQTQGAVSLIERQVGVLRQQLETERSRLNAVMARAQSYEQIASRLHQLTLKLIASQTMDAACSALRDSLRDEFAAEAVALRLFPIDERQRAKDPLVQTFVDFIATQECVCGELPEPQTEALFGDEAAQVRSAALVPISGSDHSGILAIGSSDPDRFTTDMGTDLLERLGAIASAKLADLVRREAGT